MGLVSDIEFPGSAGVGLDETRMMNEYKRVQSGEIGGDN